MYDLRELRQDPLKVQKAILDTRGVLIDFTYFLEMETVRKTSQAKLEKLQALRNQNAALAGSCKRNKDEEGFKETLRVGTIIANEITLLDSDVTIALKAQEDFALKLPNLPDPRTPIGKTEADNVVVKTVGQVLVKEQALDHQAIIEGLQRLPMGAKGALLAGARFAVLEGQVARLHRALAQFMLDKHIIAGYTEVYVPYLVNAETMKGTGQLPKFEEDLYKTTDGAYLIPTAEVPVTNLIANQVLDGNDLPLLYTAHTPCFRKEAGAAGRDVGGLIRQHQFDKVEMVRIEKPEDADKALEDLVAEAERVLVALELPYRVVELCTGDMGFGAKRTYDLEVWLPSQKTYREISSCSWCGDFQGRRMNARFKDGKNKPQFVHTLNGSGLAVGRALVAVLENHVCDDGTVNIPVALRPYVHADKLFKL